MASEVPIQPQLPRETRRDVSLAPPRCGFVASLELHLILRHLPWTHTPCQVPPAAPWSLAPPHGCLRPCRMRPAGPACPWSPASIMGGSRLLRPPPGGQRARGAEPPQKAMPRPANADACGVCAGLGRGAWGLWYKTQMNGPVAGLRAAGAPSSPCPLSPLASSQGKGPHLRVRVTRRGRGLRGGACRASGPHQVLAPQRLCSLFPSCLGRQVKGQGRGWRGPGSGELAAGAKVPVPLGPGRVLSSG